MISFTDEDRRFFISEKKEGDTLGIYSQIKGQVSTRKAAEHYGYKVSRNGMMCCPFHHDRTPSMKVDQNFICFGCQEKGNVIDFTVKLVGLSPNDAAGKLIADMDLTVTNDDIPKAPPGTRQKAKRERLEKEQFEQAVDHVTISYRRASSAFRRGDASEGLCGIPSGSSALRFKGRQGIRRDRKRKGGERS